MTTSNRARCCMRAGRILMMAMLVATIAASFTESAAASELASTPDTGMSSFSGYMVAVG